MGSNRKYRSNPENVETERIGCEKYRRENKDWINAKQRFNYDAVEAAEKREKYKNSYGNKKSKMIYKWKSRGVICENFDLLYSNYLAETHCDFCRVKFGKFRDGTSTWRCLDHDHKTGAFRAFLCNKCNVARGK